MISPLESPIAPQAPTPTVLDYFQRSEADGWCRFASDVDAGLLWIPDDVPEPRHADSESIQLENRGITQEPPCPPRPLSANPRQAELWRKQTTHKNSIAAKLREVGLDEPANALEHCHSQYTVMQCCGCNAVRKFPNRCDRLYCPECQPHLANERRKQIEWWTHSLKQPKHVVLTARNQPNLLPEHVDELRRWFTNLRKRKRYAGWKAGFYTIEVTNEGRGWHLHLHVLVEVQWVDSAALAADWDSVTNHNGHIVKVKDCRDANYLAEVSKYAVKGSQLATWTPSDIAAFIHAFEHKRTFGVFGQLYAARTEFAEWIATLKSARIRCECGCNQARFFTEVEWELSESSTNQRANAPPKPADAQQQLLLSATQSWPD